MAACARKPTIGTRMKCLAVCQNELVVRLARRGPEPRRRRRVHRREPRRSPAGSHDVGLTVIVADPRRVDTYVKADLTPAPASSSRTTAGAACGRSSTRCGRGRHAHLRPRHRPRRRRSAPTRLRADFPDITTLTLAELVGPPLLAELGRSLTRQRVQQYQRYFADADRVLILSHNDPDPDAMASGLALRNLLRRTKQTAIIGAHAGRDPAREPADGSSCSTSSVEAVTPRISSRVRQDRHSSTSSRTTSAGLLPHVDLVDRPPPGATRLQRRLQGHPRRLRLDLHDPHRAPARRGHRHLGAHRDGDALRHQVGHAVLQPPGQPRRPRRLLVPLSARRRRADPQDGGRGNHRSSASTT